jgi:phosphate-selective porin OprO and OprP
MSLVLLAIIATLSGQSLVSGQPADSTQKESPDKTPKKKAAKKDSKKDTPTFRLDEHPSIHFGKGTHLDFRARFSADGANSEAPFGDPPETSTLDFRQRRVGLSGEIRNVIGFQVEAELRSTDPWRDVYAEYRQFEFVRVRGGKFKLPFSLDANTSASNRDFVYRSLAATHLAPGRDPGVMVHGRVLKKAVGYEVGVFNHDGSNARTTNPTKVYGGQTTAGRITFEPLRNVKGAPGDLSIGVAMTRSDVPEGIAGIQGETALGENFFSSANFIVNGPRRRVGLEVLFRPGPASIKSEWIRVETERRGESVEDTDLSPLIGEGWYISGTYVVTGEKSATARSPKKPLFQGGFGAIELAARVESLQFRSGASGEVPSRGPRADVVLGNRDQVTTIGVNWFINRFLRIQGNFIREKLDDPAQGPMPAKPSYSTKVVRIQFSL